MFQLIKHTMRIHGIGRDITFNCPPGSRIIGLNPKDTAKVFPEYHLVTFLHKDNLWSLGVSVNRMDSCSEKVVAATYSYENKIKQGKGLPGYNSAVPYHVCGIDAARTVRHSEKYLHFVQFYIPLNADLILHIVFVDFTATSFDPANHPALVRFMDSLQISPPPAPRLPNLDPIDVRR